MAKVSTVMLTSTAGKLNEVGQAIKFAGYYGMSRGIGTVAVYANNLVGRVYIQGTLATNPTEKDWFPIWLEECNPFAQFPMDPNYPTGQNDGDSGVFSWTFQANLTYVRALVDRSYLQMPQMIDVGTVQQILINF
jgi:hypothetical protein